MRQFEIGGNCRFIVGRSPRFWSLADFGHPNWRCLLMVVDFQQQERIFSIKTMIAARQKLENMIATQDYKELCWITRILPIDPFLACADATMPYEGEEDAKNIANGNITLTLEDVMTFSLFPEKKRNGSVCVITWFRDNSRIEDFKKNFGFGSLSDKAVAGNIIDNALRLSLIYVSPAWWDSLSLEQQNYVWEAQLSKIRFTQDL